MIDKTCSDCGFYHEQQSSQQGYCYAVPPDATLIPDPRTGAPTAISVERIVQGKRPACHLFDTKIVIATGRH